jgi:hypothetical protein
LGDLSEAGSALEEIPMTDRTELATRLLATAKVLLQNAQGCAENHHGHDFATMGEPGWIRDCRSDIEKFEAADLLSSPIPMDEAGLRDKITSRSWAWRVGAMLRFLKENEGECLGDHPDWIAKISGLLEGPSLSEATEFESVFCRLLTADEEWKPIETGPRDGTTVDCWVGGSRFSDCFFGKPYHDCLSEYCDSCPDDLNVECWRWSFGSEPIKPTHWRPLPKPPQDLGNRGK